MKLLSSVKRWALAHKAVALITLIIIGYGGYRLIFGSGATTATPQYVLAGVAKGAVVASVSGTGQVAVSNQIDVKPKASGDIVFLPVAQGQHVRAGTLLAQLDTTDAQKSIRDNEVSLESAKLSLEKLQQSSADINQILENSFADISDTFLDLPTIVSFAQDVILGSTLNPRNQDNIGYYKDFIGQNNDVNYQKVNLFIDSARQDYTTARADYDEVFLIYKNTTRYSDAPAVQALLNKTLATTKSLAQALKSEQNLLDYLTDYGAIYGKTLPAIATTYKNSLRTDIGLVNGHLSSLASAANSIANAPLDIRSQQISITQRENALADAKATLADYSVRSPFDGIVAKLNVKKGDSASAGAAIATIITDQKIAEITLNEVDIAKVQIGQKATLTFDAIPDLTITGQVTQIDSIGTVSQGVVTYKVEIAFDTQEVSIKPGMSVSASIITMVKQDVLVVPSAAVKTQGAVSYVETVDAYKTIDAAPATARTRGVPSVNGLNRQEVTVGLVGDSVTEVMSGLSEGDAVVTRTIAGATAAASAQASGGLGGLRIPGVTGGNTRALNR